MKNRKLLREVLNVLLVILGSALLAFGDAAFITPLNLVTGGVISVGVIVQYYIGDVFQVVDIITWGMQAVLLVISFIFLGKKFTLHTILATILYPAFFTLFYRVGINADMESIGTVISNQFKDLVLNSSGQEVENFALILLSGIAGGACVGAGVAICYYGDGSTGGFDVISVIIAKHTPMKESLSALLIDGSLVLIGMICMRDIPRGLIGIISALICAVAVQYIFVNQNRFIIAEVISPKHEEIMDYVHTKMDHATTVMDVVGGYTGEDKKLIKVAFSKRELLEFKMFLGEVDPTAFVTFVQASTINGEGFDPLLTPIEQNIINSKVEETKDEENDA